MLQIGHRLLPLVAWAAIWFVLENHCLMQLGWKKCWHKGILTICSPSTNVSMQIVHSYWSNLSLLPILSSKYIRFFFRKGLPIMVMSDEDVLLSVESRLLWSLSVDTSASILYISPPSSFPRNCCRALCLASAIRRINLYVKTVSSFWIGLIILSSLLKYLVRDSLSYWARASDGSTWLCRGTRASSCRLLMCARSWPKK